MSLNAGMSLGFVFTAVDRASNVMRGVGTGFTRLENTADRASRRTQMATGAMTAGMAGVATGAKLLGTTFDAAMDAGRFEQDLGRVRLIMNASGDEMEKLRDRAIKAGMETEFSPQEALSGLKELGTLGFNSSEAIAALQGNLDLASAAGLSMAQSSATVGSAIRVFGKDASEAGEVADKLMKITTRTALQANDLQLALGNVSRGAGTAEQSLETMLTSMGLVKNTGVDASVAASSVSSALIFMSKNAGQFKKLGVEITDSEGKFKDFNKIVLETSDKLSGIEDGAERVAMAQKLFGRFGLTAFNAISSQLSDGIQDAAGNILYGEDAIKSLMSSLNNAKGTVEDFRKATLDTLPGQLKLIEGLWQTFKVEVGAVAMDMLKPIAMFVREGMERLIAGFKALSPEVRKFLGLGGMVTGVTLLVGGAGVALSAALSFIGVSLGAIAAAVAPVLAAIAALGLAFMGLKEAYDRNLGGFADTVGTIVEKVKLFFTGLWQLIDEGFLSGDTAKKLQDPNNAGILHFLIILFKWGHRAKVFVDELVTAFDVAFGRLATPFEELGKAIEHAQNTIADMTGSVDSMTPTMDSVASSAETIANFVVGVFQNLINVATILISTWSGIADTVSTYVGPVIEKIMESFGRLKDEIVNLLTELGILDSEAGANADTWQMVGNVIGGVMSTVLVPIGFAIDSVIVAFKLFTSVVTGVVKIFKAAWNEMGTAVEGFKMLLEGDFTGAMEAFSEVFSGIWDGIVDAFGGIIDSIKESLQDLMNFIAEVIIAIPEEFRPDFLTDAAMSLNPNLREGADVDLGVGEINAQEDMARQFADMGPVVPYANNVAGPEKKVVSPNGGLSADDVKKAMTEALKEGNSAVNVVVKVGEEDVAAAVEKATRSSNALAFGADSEGADG